MIFGVYEVDAADRGSPEYLFAVAADSATEAAKRGIEATGKTVIGVCSWKDYKLVTFTAEELGLVPAGKGADS